MSNQRILIAGGYGVVGHRIAAELAPDHPGQIIVAGRNAQLAEAAGSALGHGVSGRELDVTLPSSIAAALDGVSAVVSCIDQPRHHLRHAAIERGLCYTDITPHLTELGRGAAYEQLDSRARACGARLVLGAGIVPGISSVMVRAVANTLGGADEIETSLLLCARDAAGPASFDYFVQELAMPFTVHVNGSDRPARALTKPRPIEFPQPVGARPGYLFPFSDQVLYPRTMGAHTVLSRLAIEPTRLAKLLAAMVGLGAGPFIASTPVRHALMQRRVDPASRGESLFALRVDVTYHGQANCATLLGYRQADAAAAGAAGILRSLIDGEVVAPGAWMPEQVIDPARFISRLVARGLLVDVAGCSRPTEAVNHWPGAHN